MRALTLGTSILNHSIKNEIQKIDYLTERSREAVLSGDDEAAEQALQSLFGVTDHILHMVERIKQKADDISLKEINTPMQQLIAKTVDSMQPMLRAKQITLELELGSPITLICDAAHVREMLRNIITNALEAIPSTKGGVIHIQLLETKREIVIQIKDTGVGIETDHIDKVLEPFYTTKRKSSNYGLGLSYCNSVMQKHGGKLSIHSGIATGTTVQLRFPRYRKVKQVLKH